MHDHSMPTRRSFAFAPGALAELEARLAAGDLMGLPQRAKTGKLTVTDVVSVIGAGLRGGGSSFSDVAVGKTFLEGGLRGAEATATRLIEATFGEVA